MSQTGTGCPQRSKLAALALSAGEPIPTAGNIPVLLGDPNAVWYIESGALDIFLVDDDGEGTPSDLRHVIRAEAGRVAFGIDCGDVRLAAVAKGLPGSQARRIPTDSVTGQPYADELADQADAWITDFAAAIAQQIEPHPPTDVIVDAGDHRAVRSGQIASTRTGRVVWVEAANSVQYLGTEALDRDRSGLIPITSDTWVTTNGPAQLAGLSSRELCHEGRLLAALSDFHHLVLQAERLNRQVLVADEVNLQTERAAYRRLIEERARRSLFSVMETSGNTVIHAESPLLHALQTVGAHEGIAFNPPPPVRRGIDPSLDDIANFSRVRGRRIRLDPQQRWWLGDSGAMLAFGKDDGRPIALVPGAGGRYRAVDPVSRRSSYVTASRAGEFAEHAWFFYRPLPHSDRVAKRDLVRMVSKNMLPDLIRFAGSGLLASLILLAPAIALGILADQAIPMGSNRAFLQIALVLAGFAALGCLFQVLQGTALMRIEGRAAARLGAATWDRVLELPSSFFHKFTAGDLLVRLAVFQYLRDQVSGVIAGAFLSVIFLTPTFAILFIYSARLAWISLAVALATLVMISILGLLQIAPHRSRYAAGRRVSSELFQLINGMSKLRSTGAEGSAFASWANGYRDQQVARMQIGSINEHLMAFSAALPALVGAALFAASVVNDADGPNIADFLVIYAASMVFYRAVVGLGRSFEAIATMIPAYEQIRPILDAVPDHHSQSFPNVALNGSLRFDHVSFRYTQDGPQVLTDVSIHARPGEFVGIVGESGAGKSTLLRLALGLERPISGAVYYDDRDLEHLDRQSVRSQLGVVVQDVPLQPGNILENIIGIGGDLSVEDAWRAARLADVEYDIVAMPMGMFTPVGDNASTFSGGQMQRIRIAAALARNPRVLFLDEATSWLDTDSQARVIRGIESLSATRIVIAHRLSTIRNADRIYVLQDGHVAQEGTFEELLRQDGPFRGLAERQMA